MTRSDEATNDRAVERHDGRTCHGCLGTGDCGFCDGSGLCDECNDGRCQYCDGTGRAS